MWWEQHQLPSIKCFGSENKVEIKKNVWTVNQIMVNWIIDFNHYCNYYNTYSISISISLLNFIIRIKQSAYWSIILQHINSAIFKPMFIGSVKAES